MLREASNWTHTSHAFKVPHAISAHQREVPDATFDLLALGCGMNEEFGVGPDADVAIWGQAIGIG